MRLSQPLYLPSGICFWLAITTWSSPSSASTTQPISVYFDDKFRGYDGYWSTAQIRVGTPAQYLSLLPNTVSAETWVVNVDNDCGTSVAECQQTRGGFFTWSQSTSWQPLGVFEMGYSLAPTLQVGQYGLDIIALSDTIAAPMQSVALFNGTDIWLGNFGLNAKESRYNDNINHPSFISTLVHNESIIPSHSYGYTAGAYYSQRRTVGSLTLGGTDTTRYISNDVSFQLDSNNYNPLLAVRGITVSQSSGTNIPVNWQSNPQTLMNQSDAATFTIDSSTPFLWMPAAVCDAFAAALNLTYSDDLNLYVFPSNSSPQALINLDLKFNFTLATSIAASKTVNIPISYDAFNLQLSYPFPGFPGNSSDAPINYFPLRRANSTLQYIIGRAFLQESYITVDYERGNFSISEAVMFTADAPNPELVAITRPANSIWPAPQIETSHGLTSGAKAGIAVGVVLAVLLMAVAAYFCFWRRRSAQADGENGKKSTFSLLRFVKQRKNSPNVANELPADKRHPNEMQADKSNTRFELHGSDPIEMSAGEVPSSYFQGHKETSELTSSDDEKGHNSISKAALVASGEASDRSQSPVPPYTLAENTGQVNSHSTNQSQGVSSGISSQSTSNGQTFGESISSGENPISPISPTFPQSHLEDPISQTAPTSTAPQLSSSPSIDSEPRIPQINRLSSQEQTPTRTVSRSSRFREELVEEDEIAVNDDNGTKQVRHRFSWEK